MWVPGRACSHCHVIQADSYSHTEHCPSCKDLYVYSWFLSSKQGIEVYFYLVGESSKATSVPSSCEKLALEQGGSDSCSVRPERTRLNVNPDSKPPPPQKKRHEHEGCLISQHASSCELSEVTIFHVPLCCALVAPSTPP